MTSEIDFHGDALLDYSAVNPRTSSIRHMGNLFLFLEEKEAHTVAHYIPSYFPDVDFLIDELKSHPTRITGGHVLSWDCQCCPSSSEDFEILGGKPLVSYFHREAMQ